MLQLCRKVFSPSRSQNLKILEHSDAQVPSIRVFQYFQVLWPGRWKIGIHHIHNLYRDPEVAGCMHRHPLQKITDVQPTSTIFTYWRLIEWVVRCETAYNWRHNWRSVPGGPAPGFWVFFPFFSKRDGYGHWFWYKTHIYHLRMLWLNQVSFLGQIAPIIKNNNDLLMKLKTWLSLQKYTTHSKPLESSSSIYLQLTTLCYCGIDSCHVWMKSHIRRST